MASSLTQDGRALMIKTPLEKDLLLLNRFWGSEGASCLFEFELELYSEDDSIDSADLIGKNVTITLTRPGKSDRYFNGVVNQFGYVGHNRIGATYQMKIVPWLWLLDNKSDCRIFQQKSVPEIIEEVFSDLGMTDFDNSCLESNYESREYCVQYRETDFAFVSRLMEEEGLYYYFQHQDGKHVMMIADSASGYYDAEDGSVEYYPTRDLNHNITHWTHYNKFRPGKHAQQDYNFTKPDMKLLREEQSAVKVGDNGKYEIFDYPGRYESPAQGDQLTRIRMEETETDTDVVSGSSTYRSFSCGAKFQVERHHVSSEEGKSYVLTQVTHQASIAGDYMSGSTQSEIEYENQFVCIPAERCYRPPRVTRQPVVNGSQTAIVTGPSGEEIYTDEHGRVKAQFHWDRRGKRDEESSCWMRVSQIHAGQGWGAMDLPRIGEEVIVDFLEGDPDRPIITGRVYNGDNTPPFDLPAKKTRRGNATKTYKGRGYNEMSMDDTVGKEQLRVNAMYNMDSNVNNNQTLIVGSDRTDKVGNNDTETIGVNQSSTIGVNQSTSVGTSQSNSVGVSQSNNVGVSKSENVGSLSNQLVGSLKNKAVGFLVNQMVGFVYKLIVGDSYEVQSGSTITLGAGSKIVLKCGASSITMDSGGKIAIVGSDITVNSSGPANYKSGAKTTIKGGGNVDVAGPMINLN